MKSVFTIIIALSFVFVSMSETRAGGTVNLGIKKASEFIVMECTCEDSAGIDALPDSAHVFTRLNDATQNTVNQRNTVYPFIAANPDIIAIDTSKVFGDTTYWYSDQIQDIDGTPTEPTYSLAIDVVLYCHFGLANHNKGIVQVIADSLNEATANAIASLKPTTAGRTLDILATGEVAADLLMMGGAVQSATDLKDLADDGYNPTSNSIRSDLRSINGTTQSATDLKDFADEGYDPTLNNVRSDLQRWVGDPIAGIVNVGGQNVAPVDVRGWRGSRPKDLTPDSTVRVDIFSISNDSLAAKNVELDYDGTGYSKTNSTINLVTNVTNTVAVNVVEISGDGTAASNLEADYDGTGYAKTASTINTATNLTNDPTWNNTQRDSILAALADANLKDKMVPWDSLDFNDPFWEKIAGVTDSGATGSSPWSAGQRDSILAALADANLKDKVVPYDSLDFDNTYWEKLAGVSDSGATGGSSPWNTTQRDSVLAALADVNLKDKIVPFDSLDYDDTYWEKLAGVSDSGATGGGSPWSSGQRDSVLLALQDANLDDKLTKIFNATQRDSLLDALRDANLNDKVVKIFSTTQRDSLLQALEDDNLDDKVTQRFTTVQRDSLLDALQDANLRDKLVPWDSLDFTDPFWEKLANVSDSGSSGSPWSSGQRDSVLLALQDANLDDKVTKIFNATQRDSILEALADANLKDKVTPYDSLDYDATYWEKLANISDSGAAGGTGTNPFAVWAHVGQHALVEANGSNSVTQLQTDLAETTDGHFKGATVLFIGDGELETMQRRLITVYIGVSGTITFTPAISGIAATGDSILILPEAGADIIALGQVAQSGTDLKDFVDNGYDPVNDVTRSDLIMIGAVVQSATDLKDFADEGYDPILNAVNTVKNLTNDPTWNTTQRDSLLDALKDANLKDKIVPFDSLDYDNTFWAKIAGVTDSGATGSSPWSASSRDSVLAALRDANLKDKVTPFDSLNFDDTFWERLANTSDSGALGSSPWSNAQRDSILNVVTDAAFRFKLLGDSLNTPGELERLLIDGGSLAGHDGFLQTFTFEDSANANAPINQLPVFVNNFAQTMLKPYNGLTDNNGDISFNLAPGNWVVFHTSEIWNFRLDSFVVTGAATQTFEHYTDLSANHASVLGFVGGASGAFPNGTVEVQLRAYTDTTELIINDTLYGQIRVSYPTDANGKFEIPLIQTDQFTSPDTAYYRFAFKDQNGRRVRVGRGRYINVSLVAADVIAGVASFNSLTRVSPE